MKRFFLSVWFFLVFSFLLHFFQLVSLFFHLFFTVTISKIQTSFLFLEKKITSRRHHFTIRRKQCERNGNENGYKMEVKRINIKLRRREIEEKFEGIDWKEVKQMKQVQTTSRLEFGMKYIWKTTLEQVRFPPQNHFLWNCHWRWKEEKSKFHVFRLSLPGLKMSFRWFFSLFSHFFSLLPFSDYWVMKWCLRHANKMQCDFIPLSLQV